MKTIDLLSPARSRVSEQLDSGPRPAAPHERAAALALLYRNRTHRERESLFREARRLFQQDRTAFDGLYIAECRGQIRGVAWARPRPGRQIAVWPPVLAIGEPERTRTAIIAALDRYLLTWKGQVALASIRPADYEAIAGFSSCSYRYITDLARMSYRLSAQRASCRTRHLRFARYHSTDAERMQTLIDRTLHESLDCAAMRGIRRIEDVFSGMAMTPAGPSFWHFVRHGDQDIGCALLSWCEGSSSCDLVYLGLVPEARGHGWGSELIGRTQEIACSTGAERLFLCCDVNNPPALKIYRSAGFREVDRWSVFVKPY